jgi:N-methylhydantoinase A
MRFAVDTGGTFTDLLVEDNAGLHMYKTPTTPEDPVEGVLSAFGLAAADRGMEARALLARGDLLIHGTTIATNAVLTGRTAKTAFLTTYGHPDILVFREAGRMGLPMFDYSVPNPEPYVPRALTFEVPERIGADGRILHPLDERAVLALIPTLAAERVEAIGVCFLWSIVNPQHELRIGELFAKHVPGVAVSLSHAVNPSIREYRRASATCIDASLKPLMGAYLDSMSARLRAAGFAGDIMVVTSQGGVMEASEIARVPIHAVKSGPALAPVAGREYAMAEGGTDTAIVADTGGTSYDVSLVRRGRIPWTRETWIGPPYRGHMTGLPSVDVRIIGAGGGSIAAVDEAGLLRVGPSSAGAVPGPACYGQGGTRPTVTDAALILGYLDPDFFLGGRLRLDITAAATALHVHVAAPLGLELDQAAAAVLAVVTENMVGAIEGITVNQGIDPRTATLVGGGGGAGLNAIALARRLGCPQVVIPDAAAALSAAGALMSELATEFSHLHLTTAGQFDREGVNVVLADLEERCRQFIAGPGAQAYASVIDFSVEARYERQIWEMEVPLRGTRLAGAGDLELLLADVHATHREIFAIDDPGSEIEFVMWRARARCTLRVTKVRGMVDLASSRTSSRPVYFEGPGRVHAAVVSLAGMTPDVPYAGPIIVESPVTTVVINPGAVARRTTQGSLVITPWA